jgi:DNA-binding IclR family transcriptional regulator
MRLSTKGRYAVMAMTDLAKRQDESDGRAVALAEIAARQQISLSYLEQLFARLRRKGLVERARSGRRLSPGQGARDLHFRHRAGRRRTAARHPLRPHQGPAPRAAWPAASAA